MATNQLNSLMQPDEIADHQSTTMQDYIVEELNHVLYLTPAQLLGHDTHISSDSIFDLSLQNPTNGDACWDGKQVIFIPDAGYTGRASFEYTLMDTLGQTDSATVYLAI